MASSITQVFNDPSLYGHALTSLPEYVRNGVTTGTPLFYQESYSDAEINALKMKFPNLAPLIDAAEARESFLIFEHFTAIKKGPDGQPNGLIQGTNVLPTKYLEIGIRWIVGSLLATALYLTVAPMGFAIKTINLIGNELAKTRIFQQNSV